MWKNPESILNVGDEHMGIHYTILSTSMFEILVKKILIHCRKKNFHTL